MTADQVFSIANNVALLGWVLLVVLGPRRWVAPLVTGAILPLLFAILYGPLIAAHWSETPGGGFGSLSQVATLFSNRWLLLAGWVHYLAFDLFVGSWEVRDAQRNHISHWLVIPCLILTFMLGPVGLLLYFILRLARVRTLRLDMAPAEK
ncbi:MAG TPA: ABA4-like family protein [Bryobacteraceae bacterium]|nr:ABA4-like family protein [Bryobacteraceae bacterium]